MAPGAAPDRYSFTNVNHSSSLTVKTCSPDNGSTLETGIVIQNQAMSSEKQCVTNSPACLDNTKLTINTLTNMGYGKKYRAVVHFKSGTTGTVSNVKVEFSYP